MTATRRDNIVGSPERVDAPRLVGFDHLEWWVGNARVFAGFLASHFGFSVEGYAGPETGVRHRASYLLRQGDITFVVSGGLDPASPIGHHQLLHGDGVRDIALRVDSAADAIGSAVARGANPAAPLTEESDGEGTLITASVSTYGDTIHTFVERHGPPGWFAPGFEPAELITPPGQRVGLAAIDHVVGNVERGALDGWVTHYGTTFGFDELVHFDDQQISTEFTSLQSTVMWDGGGVVLPINEPADGQRKSQIQEYIEHHQGPGVQHVAMRTDDIVAATDSLRDRGVRFLSVPPAYYDDARRRMQGIDLPWDDLARLGILVDRDKQGHLLQIFTEVLTDRPTIFCEIIQREGCRGFGVGNFRALFEAIEREQERRGNL
ncbi:MAG TPA: 4-hydroxyphenylpyruvate dioxygenase [Acidimicrobiales bacterium]